jgi:hypothetical protein
VIGELTNIEMTLETKRHFYRIRGVQLNVYSLQFSRLCDESYVVQFKFYGLKFGQDSILHNI